MRKMRFIDFLFILNIRLFQWLGIFPENVAKVSPGGQKVVFFSGKVGPNVR